MSTVIVRLQRIHTANQGTKERLNLTRKTARFASDSMGALLRMLRQQRGLTQRMLADALGVSRSAIAQWETNRGGQRDEHLEHLADVLGVSSEVFLNGMAENRVQASLTIDELKLVMCYRKNSVRDRLMLLKQAERKRPLV